MLGDKPRSRIWLAAGGVVLLLFVVAAFQLYRVEQNPMRTLETWFWKLDYWAFPVEKESELADLHRNATRDSRAQCVACHDDKTNSKLVLHRIHLRSDLLRGLECHDCHQRVELATRSNTAVVTWVDVGFCKECHSPFPGLDPGSPMKPEYFERDCTTCHEGDQAPRHDQPYLTKAALQPTECKGCHGARVLPSTERHERSDWLESHGTEALASGADACYQCHDFGLKFCDECHEKTPPSHQPVERWRTIHPEAARKDTRVCYSCHRTSDCKSCHLNHEAGWLARHSAFVREKGDSSCSECHSESSCGYCHMLTTGTLEATAAP